jgi:hypothetical protein
MVLSILLWYLHPPMMVPQPSLPPQSKGIPMQIPILTPTTPTSPPSAGTNAMAWGRQKIPPLHFLPEFNLLSQYAKERDTPLIYILLFLSYAI